MFASSLLLCHPDCRLYDFGEFTGAGLVTVSNEAIEGRNLAVAETWSSAAPGSSY